MASLSKSTGISILSHQGLTHPGSIVGSAVDVSDHFAIGIYAYSASIEAIANATGALILIQGNPNASGDEGWSNLIAWRTTEDLPELETLSGSEAGGSKVLEVASTTNILAEDVIYIRDVGTLADSEWHQVDRIVTNTSVDILDGLANAKDSADVISTKAQRFYALLDLAGIARLRAVVIHRAATGSDMHFLIQGVSYTGISSV